MSLILLTSWTLHECGFSEFANDGSSGYASYSSSPIDKVEKEKEKLDSLPNLIVPEPTMATVARVDSNTHASAAAATTTANDAGGERWI